MRKIRADLVGVVQASGKTFAAGDEIPEGVSVHESLVDGEIEETGDGSEAAESTENGAGADENASEASESTEPAPDAGEAPEEAPATESEDFSDLLGDEEPEKAPAKRVSGRKPAAKRG